MAVLLKYPWVTGFVTSNHLG